MILQIKNCRIVTIRQAMKHGNYFPRKESAVLFKLCSRHLSLRSLTAVKIKLRPINEIQDAVTTIEALFNSDTFRGIKEDDFTSHLIISRKKRAVSIGNDDRKAIIALQTQEHQKKPLKCGRIEFGVLGFKINLSLGRVISKRIMIMQKQSLHNQYGKYSHYVLTIKWIFLTLRLTGRKSFGSK